MNIGKVIFTHRKQRNMTQEQLAEKLGVSVPAVSKWETNVSMPDITLLAPIARLFHISIDTLLAFQSELSQEEIQEFLKEARRRVKEQGLAEGMRYIEKLLTQYPNSERLRLEAAFGLSGLKSLAGLELTTLSAEQQEEQLKVIQDCGDRVVAMFEELMHSEDYYVSNAAKTGVASSYMGSGRLDEAEAIFQQMKLPREWNSNHILPTVYLLKQEYDRAFYAAEENLMADWQDVVIDLRTIYNIVLKKQDYDRALKLAQAVCTISDCFGPGGLNQGMDMLVEVHILRGELAQAQAAFERYIDWLIGSDGPSGKRYSEVFFAEAYEQGLYGRKEDSREEAELNVLQVMYQAIVQDTRYEVIRGTEAYQRCMRKLEEYL
ncbi:transcriptional regulator with XRE-family HTH domain [Anaerotaenia torta]|uniref:helix-turn-helix domain-containing protein n=1 Tax=Anaerotaenia torta TaxID=433293 RepID=UPI003D262359